MRRSLALVAVAVTAMVALAFLIPLAVGVMEIAESRALADAERQAATIVPALVLTDDVAALERALASTPAGVSRLAVHLSGGRTVGRSRVGPADVANAAERARTVPVANGYVLLRPVALGGGRSAVIEAYAPEADAKKGVSTSWAVLTGVAVTLVVGSVVVADRLGARVVRAARRLGQAAAALGAGDLSVRIIPDGPPELVAAGRAFNAMADQVAVLLAAERELAADLSHRLRTPLTALRLNLGGSGPEAEQQRRLAIDRLEHAVDEIIEASRRPARRAVPAGCDAALVLCERLAFWSALAEDQGRPWQLVGADETTPVPVAAADLGAVVDALLGNVFRHTPQGTAFRVTLHRGSGIVGVLVADAGPGIPDPAKALRRGNSGAGSTGLGLDIARRLAESTGGGVRVEHSALGGTGVNLWLRTDGRAAAPRRGLLRRARGGAAGSPVR
ncbi:HAMP domain-containing histidine kinase [Microbispora sp. NBC_01189]|uniref:sensor histidine kinase n=1 Tax=Microbispora sp. NBC_01189 TaxID=2903583 RepID=UPI002E14018E|nr:HAMP domain-containing histidine kinase [Microbispora sp. NBC_01189]